MRPYLKAVTPALLTVVAVLLEWAGTGVFDKAELTTAIVGGLSALASFAVPNAVPVLDLTPPAGLKVDRTEPDESRPRKTRHKQA